jgi:hypothetical protein
MNKENYIDKVMRRYKKVEILRSIEELLREWTTLDEDEIWKALKEEIQAPVDTHEDTHCMVQRNDQSHEIRRRRAPVKFKEPVEAEESSESTDYEDSSLIESFYTQLAFQDCDEKAISQQVLNRE